MELYLHLVRKVLTVMVSIGKVEYRMYGNFIGIYRDGILFVKVQEEELYLLNDQGTFVKVDNKEQDIQDKLKKAYNLALIVT
jgi:TfoX/Sxy family transcriptional regulator of competence genes